MPPRDDASPTPRTLWLAVGAVALAGVLTALDGPKAGAHSAAVLAVAAVAGFLGSRALRTADARRLDRLRLAARAALDPAEGPEPTDGALVSALASRAAQLSGALDAERANLRALADAHDEPVLATDDRALVLLINRAAEQFLEVSPGALTGASAAGHLAEAGLLDAHDAARQGEPGFSTVRAPTRLGTRTLQVASSPLRLAHGATGALLVWRDVTDLARALQMRTDFVANASHELRTPLSAIRAAIETLIDGGASDPARGPRLLAMAEGHVLRLDEIINDLLDLSRLESPDATLRIEPVRLDELRSSLAQPFDAVCVRRDVKIDFRFDPALDGAVTDPRLVHLILRNLIDNATKFCNVGTTVEVLGRRAGPRLRFEVRDEGVGIPLAEQPRVWERFYQVDPARSGRPLGGAKRGTGLGLSIVRNAVRALGGEVGLESEYGRGTRVWFEVPESSPVPDDAPPVSAEHPAID